MEFIPHISSLIYSSWTGWLMLGLLLCAILAEVAQPGVLSGAAISLFARSNRTYHAAPNNVVGQLLIFTFRIGTMTMALCMCFYTTGHFAFMTYLKVCGVVLSMLVFKMIANTLVDYAFSISRLYGEAHEHYANLLTLAMLVLYPCLLVLIRWYNVNVNRWVVGMICIVFCLAWLIRCFRTYATSVASVVYILIHYITVEILPMTGMVYVTAQKIFTI